MRTKSGLSIKIIVSVTFLLAAISIFLAALMPGTSEFLSKTDNVEANVLVVEGWLPQYGFELAYKEFKDHNYDLIVTTGIKSPDLDFCQVAMNGYLIFYPNLSDPAKDQRKEHFIEVVAHSEMGGTYSTHFSFFVNDSMIKDFTADEKVRKYGIVWEGALSEIDSVMIYFDNDAVDDFGDRNLYVRQIIFDNKIIIPYQFNSVFDAGRLDGENRIINNYKSIAEVARNSLIDLGVEPSRIEAVPGNRTRINRTLTSALALVDWLKASDRRVTGINVMSRGIHSRRTWMTYKSIINKAYKIGIISLPESSGTGPGKLKYDDVVVEVLSYIYYRIILIPYALFN
jgi:hypothetical protein